MQSFLNIFFDNSYKVYPYLLVLFVILGTYMSITTSSLSLAIFHAFATCTNGVAIYYLQTRKHI